MKYNCAQFNHLLETVSKYTTPRMENGFGFADGKIGGFSFRMFQQINTQEPGEEYEGQNDEYRAYLLIKDETAVGSKWPSFGNGSEIDDWAAKREIEGL